MRPLHLRHPASRGADPPHRAPSAPAPMHRWTLRRGLLALAGVLLAVCALPREASAQCYQLPDGTYWCDDGSGPGVDGPPMVFISPEGSTRAQPSVPVTIILSDDYTLVDSTFQVFRGTENVTSQFVFTRQEGNQFIRARATATGSITLSEDAPVQLTARICDHLRQCTTEGATYTIGMAAVEVTPDATFGTTTIGGPRTVTFKIKNRGKALAPFALTPECHDDQGQALSSCTVSVSSVSIAAGDSTTAVLTYPGTQVGVVTLKLRARQTDAPGVEDGGWINVALRAPSGSALAAPEVALVPLNLGPMAERSQCVTVAIAPRAAYECGDLRIVHGLPAHLSRGRAWAPALLYSSRWAQPRPTVYADVTVPSGTAVPTWVELAVTLRDGTVHKARFTGSGFIPGLTRRVAVQWNGLNTTTGLYAYDLQVTSIYPGQSRASAVFPGEVAVVNRSSSPFGNGWWLAGLERIFCVDCATGGSRMLWAGGDGSTRVYEPVSPGSWTQWIAQHPDGPADTITLADSGYVRRLRGGGSVYFNAAGLHYLTVNRLGQTTQFAYNSLGPSAIYVPGAGPGGPGTGDPAWTFVWDNTAQRIRRIQATVDGGPMRETLLNGDTQGRVTSIQDPDGKTVAFGFHTTWTRYVVQQRDRRGSWSFFGYDATGRINSTRLRMGTVNDGTVDPITSFVSAQSRGVAQSGDTLGASWAVADVWTRIDGPRKDVSDLTFLWLDRNGAIRRTADPMGAETFVQHGDARFPALATRVLSATGVVSSASYDHRGRVLAATVAGGFGGAETSTTLYGWSADRCERPVWTKAPGMDTVWVEYDPATCSPRWQRLGRDEGRRVDFAYHGAGHPHRGQVESVTGPVDAEGRRGVERYAYDARGNLRMTVSPAGHHTLIHRDGLGREQVVYTPISTASALDTLSLKANGARRTTQYDRSGRDSLTLTWAPTLVHAPSPDGVQPDPSPEEWLQVVTLYDAEGSPLTVTRTMSPNPAGLEPQVTTYLYDGLGRRTDEWTSDIHHHYDFDLAGNVVSASTPRFGQITSRYDAAGRLVLRKVPQAHYNKTTAQCGQNPGIIIGPICQGGAIPIFPNSGTGYRVPEEWTYFRYDRVGNLVYAENADAVVQRRYHPNGMISTDTSRIREFGTDGFTQVYGILYGYHTATGTLSSLNHPTNLAGSATADAYGYDPATGALANMNDRNGNYFSFHYDNAGRLTQLAMPGGVTDDRRYDVDGRLVWRREVSPAHGTALQEETYAYDGRDKLMRVTTPSTLNRPASSVFSQWYSGLGNLVFTDWDNLNDPQWQRERFTVDPLGNTVHRHTYGPGGEYGFNDEPDFEYLLDTGYGRVRRISLVDVAGYPPGTPPEYIPADDTDRTYDMAGNVETSYQRVYGRSESDGSYGVRRLVNEKSFYGMDERLRAFQRYDDSYEGTQATSSGVWEEYRYDPLGRRVAVRTRRTYPLCSAGPQTCISSTTYFVWSGDQLLWERKTVEDNGPYEAGGTVSYAHAGGIDRPLAIWKSGVGTIVTHQNWRGQFARGTYGQDNARVGQSSECTQYPPQNCVPVPWPGWNSGPWHEDASSPAATGYDHYWLGSLAIGMRDASGQLYMRNRYYDPKTGQFTQPDPIGLAGGLNAYGFAAGDPVSYSDPYGLRACPVEFGGDGRTDLFSDCPAGSPGWYANRIATGEGSKVLNVIGGVLSTCGHDGRCIRTALRFLPGARQVYGRMMKSARQFAVAQAWREEAALVAAGGEGTRNWTDAERTELLQSGQVSGYAGHHINNVADHPHLAGNPDNIKFVKQGAEHLAEHAGSYRNKTTGPLLDRSQP